MHALCSTLLTGTPVLATGPGAAGIGGIPVEFILFALTLLGVALFHHRTFLVALLGMSAVTIYKLAFTGFKTGAGVAGFIGHLGHEWVTLANLLCLLLGFAILARHFEDSRAPEILPRFLPDDWKGPFVLLAMVWGISSFLDNIAAAMIGGAMAHKLFAGKVHLGYLAAIVAASNAGGSFSVVGDTTTTMMWIAGVRPLAVFEAIIAAVVALLISGIIAAKQQHAHHPITANAGPGVTVDRGHLAIVGLILLLAMGTNLAINLLMPERSGVFPFIGVAVWVAILVTIPLRPHPWKVLREALTGTFFLLFLVVTASMMPVEKLPAPSWQAAMSLGFVSAVFDNIPLTALAIQQDGYDWGFLAFAVGYGGSILWFGSSAGVALSTMYPEAKSAGRWLRHGWHVPLAYVVAFFAMLLVLKWHPEMIKQAPLPTTPANANKNPF